MRRAFVADALFVCLVLIGDGAEAKRLTDAPLVGASWLKNNLDDPSLVVLDVRTATQGGGSAGFAAGHVPGAVFADYETAGWRTTINGVPGMLPPISDVEKLIGSLGIDNGKHVVIVPEGKNSTDFGAATRVYWTFKIVGHDAVSILDGGWRAWMADTANPIATSGAAAPKPAKFTAAFRPELVADAGDVARAAASGVPLVDARPEPQYLSKAKSPVVKRAGTIPGAVNVENTRFYESETGTFSAKETIAALLKKTGVKAEGDAITFCNTGHWASVAWFGLSEVLGNKSTRMYDGSMADWTMDPARPVEIKSPQ